MSEYILGVYVEEEPRGEFLKSLWDSIQAAFLRKNYYGPINIKIDKTVVRMDRGGIEPWPYFHVYAAGGFDG